MWTRNNYSNAARLVVGLALFTMLTGARGCSVQSSGSGYTTYGSSPAGTVVSGPVHSAPAPIPVSSSVIYQGDVALTVYSPLVSSVTPETVSFNVTVRSGGAFGPVIVEGSGFVFDGFGVGAVDIVDLEFGFYDVEVVGLDAFGSVVSYAASGLTVEEGLTSLVMELEATSFAGDVVLELYAPDGGQFENPIDTVDYVLWEVDAVTGELIFVEEMTELLYLSWDPVTIASLQLAEYYIEVFAYDALGWEIYQFGGYFTHDADVTYMPVDLWYTN